MNVIFCIHCTQYYRMSFSGVTRNRCLLTPKVSVSYTVYPKKYAHGFCFAVLCCGYTLTDFPISIRLTSLALWQSNDCPSTSKATLMNMDKYFMWIHYERLHNHNKAKHNKTVCIFHGIYCKYWDQHFLITAPAYDLPHNGAETSLGTWPTIWGIYLHITDENRLTSFKRADQDIRSNLW